MIKLSFIRHNFVFKFQISTKILQGELIKYMTSWGKILLYVLILIIYCINSIILISRALSTDKSLKLRIDFERKRGRPIDSLDRFDLLFSRVKRTTNLL